MVSKESQPHSSKTPNILLYPNTITLSLSLSLSLSHKHTYKSVIVSAHLLTITRYVDDASAAYPWDCAPRAW